MAFFALEGVSKAYGAGAERTEVLRDVDLELAEGEFVAIVGFSGSGKTTLISLMAGLLEPDAGRVRLEGREVRAPGPERGIVFQNYSLLPWLSVRGNVELGVRHVAAYATCPDCGQWLTGKADDAELPMSAARAKVVLDENRTACPHCSGRLWTLTRKGKPQRSYRELVVDALQQLPTIGVKTAENLVNRFGEAMLGAMLADNVFEFINLMDEEGELVFSDRQAARIELSSALGQKVHLFLLVKVRENWADDPDRYREMGIEFPKN